MLSASEDSKHEAWKIFIWMDITGIFINSCGATLQKPSG